MNAGETSRNDAGQSTPCSAQPGGPALIGARRRWIRAIPRTRSPCLVRITASPSPARAMLRLVRWVVCASGPAHDSAFRGRFCARAQPLAHQRHQPVGVGDQYVCAARSTSRDFASGVCLVHGGLRVLSRDAGMCLRLLARRQVRSREKFSIARTLQYIPRGRDRTRDTTRRRLEHFCWVFLSLQRRRRLVCWDADVRNKAGSIHKR